MSDADMSYTDVYNDWQTDPEGFWAAAATDIAWFKLWDRVFDPYMGQYGRWFRGGQTNAAYNCLDRHIHAGQGEKIALLGDPTSSAAPSAQSSYTYAELTDEVAALAAVLLDRGVKAGDRVFIHVPMSAHAIMGMLACARIGAVHCVVRTDRSAAELAELFEQLTPAAVLASTAGYRGGRAVTIKPVLDEAVVIAAHKPATVIVAQNPDFPILSSTPGRDIDWAGSVKEAKARNRAAACAVVEATDPLFVLPAHAAANGAAELLMYDSGGYCTGLSWMCTNVLGLTGRDNIWATADLDTIEGHSYACYAPLLAGATLVITRPLAAVGDAPTAGAELSRIFTDFKVTAMLAEPGTLEAFSKSKLDAPIRGPQLEVVFVTGTSFSPEAVAWAQKAFDVPIVSQLASPLTGGAYAVNPAGLGIEAGAGDDAALPIPGFRLTAMGANGAAGPILIKLPMPPFCAPGLWNDRLGFHARFATMLPGHVETTLEGRSTADNGVAVTGRVARDPQSQPSVEPVAQSKPQSRGVTHTVSHGPSPSMPTAGPANQLRQSIGCFGGGHAGRRLQPPVTEHPVAAALALPVFAASPRRTLGCYGGGTSGRVATMSYPEPFCARRSLGCFGGGTSGRHSPDGVVSSGLAAAPRRSVGCYGGGHAGLS